MSREGRKRVDFESLLLQWDEALDENRRIMEPIIGRMVIYGLQKEESEWDDYRP